VWGSAAGGVWPEMALLVDGGVVHTATVDHADRRDCTFPTELTAGVHEIAVAFLNDALVGDEDRNLYIERITLRAPQGAGAPALAGIAEVAAAAQQREQDVLHATAASIARHRQRDAVLIVVDQEGQPMPNLDVSVDQIGHDFLFGCNIYGFDRFRSDADNAAYRDRFAELFNYATVGFYWRWYEVERGKPQYEYTDKVVAWCQQRGIRLKGHPLLWGDEAGVPPWSDGQPAPEIQRHRVAEIMGRYRGKIEFWEVVNEPSHLAEPKIGQPYRWAREVDPEAYLIVNDYHVLADGAPGFHRLLEQAVRDQVPFDGIGIQAHEPRTMRFPLDRVQAILDQYATFGKELHITEFTPTSSGQPIAGSYREGVWDEAAQAEYAVQFYRVCFAHPAMRAITWWDLSDAASWLPGGGMLRADMSRKPVYEQLKRLIHQEWHTAAQGCTDENGRWTFRGFHGTYRLSATVAGRAVTADVRVRPHGPAELTVVLPRSQKR
ncbi:MAG: endo-1,4-beta-xylanase, partial [Pirellulaceae bacterium]|nr:endo-1,4-beta-xylanase [Pirellulaceae bacterium]